jgi:phenylpropionate dioxygenase-like ring-hydroxylating dioxygenase large terminal subunit
MKVTEPRSLEMTELIRGQRAGWALERPFYTDPALFEREMERVILRQWLYAGHISRIPHPGDYFTYQVGAEPFLILRGDDGEVRALLNVCRHKGAKLCLEGSGSVRKLVCPYHQWLYDTDGALLRARHMPAGFDPAEFSLHRAHVRSTDGLIFLCLAETPPPFPAPPPEVMRPYELETAKVAHHAAYHVRANWKIVLENFQECYHCGTVHPEYTALMAGARSSYLSREEEIAEAGRTREQLRVDLAGLGLDPHSPRLQFRQDACTQSLDGRPVAPLMGAHRDYDGTMVPVWIGWTFEMEACPDHVTTFRFTPLAADLTHVEVEWLARGDAVEGTDYDRERLTAFWKITGEQDWAICECVQEGVASRFYRPGPLSDAEGGPRRFLSDYLAQMEAPEG